MEGSLRSKRLVAALAMVAGLLAVGLTPGEAQGSTADRSGLAAGVSPADLAGQTVVFHMDGYALNSTLLFTTRTLEPGAEQPQFADMSFTGPQRFQLLPNHTHLDAVASRGFKARPYLVGHSVGDVVWTPYIFAPFPSKPVQVLSTTIGPVAPEVTLNLTRLYADTTQDASSLYGGPDAFRVGATLRYSGVLDATVVAVEDDVATLAITANGGEVIPARALGLAATVSKDADGNLFLHPMANVGDKFVTQGCPLPGAVLAPGAYEVVTVTASEIAVKPQVRHEYLYSQPVQFKFEIMAIEP